MPYTHPLYIVLSDIRSAANVGAIFRTADAAGVTEVILSGYTPAPIDRFGRARADIHKAALGAETWMSWRQFGNHEECLSWLKAQATTPVVIEQTPTATSYRDYRITGPTAVILGNEVEGVPNIFLAAAETHLMIPMMGKKESLNVSVAAGVILFGLQN